MGEGEEEREREKKRKEERRNTKVAVTKEVDVAQQRQTLPIFINSSAGRSCVLVVLLLQNVLFICQRHAGLKTLGSLAHYRYLIGRYLYRANQRALVCRRSRHPIRGPQSVASAVDWSTCRPVGYRGFCWSPGNS